MISPYPSGGGEGGSWRIRRNRLIKVIVTYAIATYARVLLLKILKKWGDSMWNLQV